MARNSAVAEEKQVDPEDVAESLAKAVYDGDIVNFRLLFNPFSPARKTSPESFDTDKYAYLLPSDEKAADPVFQEIVAQVKEPSVWEHIQQELEANRPARMPSSLVLKLADRAVARGKYTSAAQAYEQLRVRQRMREEFLKIGDTALDAGDVPLAVRAYRIGAGMEYNYAAFPEPLPVVPNYQTRALILHGDYPARPEDAVGMQPAESLVWTALAYLLNSDEAAARLERQPMERKVAFLDRLIREMDPGWDAFVAQCGEAVRLARKFNERIQGIVRQSDGSPDGLAEELSEQLGDDPRRISNALLGFSSNCEYDWWQYVKDLAYRHPAGVLFVARQLVGNLEIVVPRFRSNSPLADALDLRAVVGAAGVTDALPAEGTGGGDDGDGAPSEQDPIQ